MTNNNGEALGEEWAKARIGEIIGNPEEHQQDIKKLYTLLDQPSNNGNNSKAGLFPQICFTTFFLSDDCFNCQWFKKCCKKRVEENMSLKEENPADEQMVQPYASGSPIEPQEILLNESESEVLRDTLYDIQDFDKTLAGLVADVSKLELIQESLNSIEQENQKIISILSGSAITYDAFISIYNLKKKKREKLVVRVKEILAENDIENYKAKIDINEQGIVKLIIENEKEEHNEPNL